MSRYTPFTWADDPAGGTAITALRLNAIEAGLDLDIPVADIDATGTASGTTFLRGDGVWATPAGGGGATELDDLTDVDLTTTPPSDGDVLTYDSVSSEWIAAAPTGGGGGAVTSVNGDTGVVVLTQDDIADGSTYVQFSAAQETKLAGIETAANATPAASTTVAGAVELATSAETTTGTDTVRAVTPAGVKAVADTKAASSHSHAASDVTSGTIATARLGSGTASSTTYLKGDQTYAALPTASDTVQGIVELATTGEATTGTDTARAVTAAGVKAVLDAHVALSDPHTQYLKETDAANYRDAVFSQGGTLTTGTGVFRLYNRSGVTRTIQSVTASVGTQPTGASILVDVNISGTTIFTTQSNRPTIAVSTNEDQSGAPDVTAWTSGSYLTIDIDQIGSTVAGANLVVTVVYS